MPYETQCKMGRTSAKSSFPRSRFEIFRNERTRSTPLHPKVMFWRVLYYLGAFGTVWLFYETRCKTGRTSAKVRNRKSRQIFAQRTHLFHPIGPQTHVLAHFILFGCIWDNCLPYETRCKMGRTSAKSSCHEVASEFFTTNAPDPPHWTLN